MKLKRGIGHAATAGGLPIVGSAIPKLTQLADKFGGTADELATTVLANGQRFTDMANQGYTNILMARPDGVAGFLRITVDPRTEEIVSAGMMRAGQVANGIASGRLVPLQ